MSNRSHNVSHASHLYVCLRARAANVALYVLSKSENEATLNRLGRAHGSLGGSSTLGDRGLGVLPSLT